MDLMNKKNRLSCNKKSSRPKLLSYGNSTVKKSFEDYDENSMVNLEAAQLKIKLDFHAAISKDENN